MKHKVTHFYGLGSNEMHSVQYVVCLHLLCVSLGTHAHTCASSRFPVRVPCLCFGHVSVCSQPQQPKTAEWQPYLLQTLAMSTRIVNNMRGCVRTNIISVKSHLQTAAIFISVPLRFWLHGTLLKVWEKGLYLMLDWRIFGGRGMGKCKYSCMWTKISWALSRGMCT